MTELRGTFDAAKADWDKLFVGSPKSIDDIDVIVIGLHDKTIDEKREFVAIDRVLEIIDRLAKKEISGSIDKEVGYGEATDDFREAVLALKGGEQK